MSQPIVRWEKLRPEWRESREAKVAMLRDLRSRIVAGFETLEPSRRFERQEWKHHTGVGGGEMSVLRGDVFEKAAVNWSAVGGEQFPMRDGVGPFFATGVSLITHMRNPFAPTVHFNIRYIEAGDECWFGGGFDLTPMGFPFAEDTEHFHHVARQSVESFGAGVHEQMQKAAAEYFYIPHRKRERGVGGIFFDHLKLAEVPHAEALWQSVGDHFLEAILPIYQRRIAMPYSEEDRAVQAKFRAHYVEFNLLYDRGTKFGFASGGNAEAILCSMPPTASW